MGLKKNQEFKEQLIERAKILNIDHAIHFANMTENIEDEYRQCDIALNFSESESFSRTCLEALTYGIPLIATDCGGPAELFIDGESGILVPNRNIKEMSSAILKLASSPVLRKKFSVNSQIYVRGKFSIQNTHDKLKELYADILSC